MALLVTGNWYEVTWLQTSDAAWAALAPPPGIPSAMADAFVNGTTMVIYVTDSATGEFVFEGGMATGFDDTLINTASAALTENTWTTDDSTSYIYGISGAATVWFYDSANVTLRSFPAVQSTAMKAFIP